MTQNEYLSKLKAGTLTPMERLEAGFDPKFKRSSAGLGLSEIEQEELNQRTGAQTVAPLSPVERIARGLK